MQIAHSGTSAAAAAPGEAAAAAGGSIDAPIAAGIGGAAAPNAGPGGGGALAPAAANAKACGGAGLPGLTGAYGIEETGTGCQLPCPTLIPPS